MDLIKSLVVCFRDASDKLKTASNLVYLSEADLVRDEPRKIAVPEPSRNLRMKLAAGAETEGALAISSLEESAGLVTVPKSGVTNIRTDLTLGQLLTETRERHGITPAKVTEQIQIPAHYLRMIETGIYDAVPDELYLVPFIRRYADFLGLDPQEVVFRFIQDFERAEGEPIDVEGSAPRLKDQRTLRISLLGLGSLFAAVLVSYVGSKIGFVPTTASHTSAVPSVIATQHQNRTVGPPTVSSSMAEAGGGSVDSTQTPALNPVALAASAPADQQRNNQRTTSNQRRSGHGRRLNHRRRHRAP